MNALTAWASASRISMRGRRRSRRSSRCTGTRSCLIFTGNNNSFNTSGFTTAALDRIAEWLDSGGKLFTTGQNMAETTDNNTSFKSPSIGRGRLYHGYLGVRNDAGSAYAAAAPRPTANGVGPFAGMTRRREPRRDGAGNQSSIEVTSPMPDNDTYEAAHTMTPLLRAIGSSAQGPTAAHLVRPLVRAEPRRGAVEYRYRSLSMGFGLEAVNQHRRSPAGHQLARPRGVAARPDHVRRDHGRRRGSRRQGAKK